MICSLNPSTCNIFEENPFLRKNWIHGVVCTKAMCGCSDNYRIPKFRSPADAQQFIDELKLQVSEIVRQVIADPSNRHVTVMEETKTAKTSNKAAEEKPKKRTTKKKPTEAGPTAATQASSATVVQSSDPLVGQPCPVCGQGHIIKGKTAYGCSRWKEGCTWRKPFDEKP
jgi:DNA topoisomerase-3